jgi:hypothetical protein
LIAKSNKGLTHYEIYRQAINEFPDRREFSHFLLVDQGYQLVPGTQSTWGLYDFSDHFCDLFDDVSHTAKSRFLGEFSGAFLDQRQ